MLMLIDAMLSDGAALRRRERCPLMFAPFTAARYADATCPYARAF